MLNYAILFFVLALVAGALGYFGLAAIASQFAWVLLIIGVVLFDTEELSLDGFKLRNATVPNATSKLARAAARSPKDNLLNGKWALPAFSPARRARNRKSKSPGASTVPRLDKMPCNFRCSSLNVLHSGQVPKCRVAKPLSKSSGAVSSTSRRRFWQSIVLIVFLRYKHSSFHARSRAPG